jgi:transcriptional regulator with XRE-family HTH domain
MTSDAGRADDFAATADSKSDPPRPAHDAFEDGPAGVGDDQLLAIFRPHPDGPAGEGTLAERIEYLFQNMYPRNRGPYTMEEVVDGLRARGGPTISYNFLHALRRGTRDNPTKQHLEALASWFGVPVSYFFDDEVSTRVRSQIKLLSAMRNNAIRNIALRASELTPEGLSALADIIDDVARLQRSARRGAPEDVLEDDTSGQGGRS